MELVQKRLFSSHHFKVNETTLFISTRSFITGNKAWSVKLDEINFEHNVREVGLFSNGCLFATSVIIFTTLAIVTLPPVTALVVFIISMTPMILGRLVNHYSYINLNTKRGTVLLGNSKREKSQTEQFLIVLKEASKKYLIWKYGMVDSDLSFEKQIENYWWLRNNEIITDEEYNKLKADLKASRSRANS